MSNNYNNVHKANFSKNQTQSSQKEKVFIPIPKKQQDLLNKSSCNFSLYSPRMVGWRNERGEFKSATEMMKLLKEQSANSFSCVDAGIKRKQEQQAAYIESLKEMGVKTFSFKAKTISPFITGLGSGHPTETGMILDRNLGVPYIPASSIKGVMRVAVAVNIALKNTEKEGKIDDDDPELVRFFGTFNDKAKIKKQRGQLVFLDAYPAGKVELKVDIMNPHFSKYYDGTNKMPVETESPVPIKFLCVPKDTVFVFRCYLLPLEGQIFSDDDIKLVENMFQIAFSKVGFGGKTAIGYGRFEVLSENEMQELEVQVKNVSLTELVKGNVYEALLTGKNKKGTFWVAKVEETGEVKCTITSGSVPSDKKENDRVKIKIITAPANGNCNCEYIGG